MIPCFARKLRVDLSAILRDRLVATATVAGGSVISSYSPTGAHRFMIAAVRI